MIIDADKFRGRGSAVMGKVGYSGDHKSAFIRSFYNRDGLSS
jgi:hypothetical protein